VRRAACHAVRCDAAVRFCSLAQLEDPQTKQPGERFIWHAAASKGRDCTQLVQRQIILSKSIVSVLAPIAPSVWSPHRFAPSLLRAHGASGMSAQSVHTLRDLHADVMSLEKEKFAGSARAFAKPAFREP
jgi:hypothetical protein